MNAPKTSAGWRWLEVAIVILLVAAAFGVRIAKMHEVVDRGTVYLFPDDPPYHIRRAMMTLEDWPRVPTFDPMLNFPYGSEITWPPGMAWLLAGSAWLAGARGPADLAKVEHLAIWFPPSVAALTLLVFYLLARRVLGSGPAVFAAVVLIVLPAHAQYTVIGRYDHHIFEPLLTWLFLCGVGLAADSTSSRGFWAPALVSAACAGLALLLWPGALLHLALFFIALLAVVLGLSWAQPAPARRLARACTAVFALSTVAAVPAVVLSPWALRPVHFAASPLQLACLAAAATVFFAMGWELRRFKRFGVLSRTATALIAVAALFLCVPPLRQAALDGIRYASGNPFAALASESSGLLSDPRGFLDLTGWPALLATVGCVALLPRLFGLTAGKASLAALLIAGLITFAAGALAVRWLVAWAPLGAFAAGATWAFGIRPLGERWSPGRPRRWSILWGAAALALGVPALLDTLSLDLASPRRQQAARFFKELRHLTPAAAANEYDSRSRPSYGLLASWSSGHWITYLSGRPTLANNFFGADWQDRANALALRLLLSPDCEQVAEEMERLRLRYVVIAPPEPRELPAMARLAGFDPAQFVGPRGELLEGIRRSLLVRLGPLDGQSTLLEGKAGRQLLPACSRFRLLAELPSGDRTPGGVKIFERVLGAAVEVRGPPGAAASVSLRLRTRGGRSFNWVSQGSIGSDGRARFRVPYPTDGSCWSRASPCPVTAEPAYRAVVGGAGRWVRVSERAIWTGTQVR